MENQRKAIGNLGCALYFLCVAPSGYVNNNYYNNDNNGVRPFWWIARQSRLCRNPCTTSKERTTFPKG